MSMKDVLEAQEYFETVVQGKGVPANTKVFQFGGRCISIVDLVISCNLADSKTQARKLILQGGVSINNIKVNYVNYIVDFNLDEQVLKVGKRGFAKFKRLVII